jgi:uncharacterized protein YndB with AHSA1/START domain
MAAHDIVFQMDLDADRDRVVSALTTEAGINGWWTDRALVPASVGGVLELTFPGVPLPFRLELMERGDRRIAWATRDFPPPWAGTSVDWELTDRDGPGTRIDFSHRNWDRANPTIGTVTFGWGQILVRLKAYAETGQAQPFFVN